VVLSPNELSGIFRRHQTTDLFLIDTAGRSQKDVAHIAELATYYNMGNPTSGDTAVKISGQLILPASLRSDVLLEVVQRFSGVPIQGIIFTKLDEVNSYGSIFNTMIWAQCPLSYLTMGQRVPEDIELATPEKVAHWVMD
jgi:flagellar biosynthesis protein FlhF